MIGRTRHLAVSAVFCLGVVVCTLLLIRFNEREGTKERGISEAALPHAVYASESGTANTQSEDVLGAEKFSSLVFSDTCPTELTGEVLNDVDCLEAVEQHFLDKPVYFTDYIGMVSRDSSFTYRMMFQSHERDKELVVQALSRPECYLTEGPIRLDLRETCSADAFSRYTYFLKFCRHVSDDASDESQDGSQWFKPDELNGEKTFYQTALSELQQIREEGDIEQYYALRNQFREFLLKDIWIKHQCPAHDSSDLRPYLPSIGSNDLDYAASRANEGRTIADMLAGETLSNPKSSKQNRPSSEWVEKELINKNPTAERSLRHLNNQFDLIRVVAARLGADWLLINQDWRSLYWDKIFWESYKEMFPWKIYLDDAVRDSISDRTSAILYATRGLVALERAGYEPDVQEIVLHICGKEVEEEELEDCATAMSNTEMLLQATAIDELRTLDELAAAAKSLDLYLNF